MVSTRGAQSPKRRKKSDASEASEETLKASTPLPATSTPKKPRSDRRKSKSKKGDDKHSEALIPLEAPGSSSKAKKTATPRSSSRKRPKVKASGEEKVKDNAVDPASTVDMDVEQPTTKEQKFNVSSKPDQLLPNKSPRGSLHLYTSISHRPRYSSSAYRPIPFTKAAPSSTQKKRKSIAPPSLADEAPILDVSVHRIRHFEYKPKGILYMQSTPSCLDQAFDYVAVSRDNGSVELRSPNQKYRVVGHVAGMKTRTVDVMAWITTPQSIDETVVGVAAFASSFHQSHALIHSRRFLIGASRDGTIFIVDFRTGRHVAVVSSGGGGVFSLISLQGSELVAAGCEDGCVRIYKLQFRTDTEWIERKSSAPKLVLVSTLPSAGAAVLSIAWQRYGDGEGNSNNNDSMAGTVLFTGVADGTIRRYDCASKMTANRSSGMAVAAIGLDGTTARTSSNYSWKSRFRMTVENYGRAEPTRVWALRALKDGTVISGDSLGHVQFWNGNTGTLNKSFVQNDSKADVLALAVSDNECKVFASGIDSRVVCIERSTRKSEKQEHNVGTASSDYWVLSQSQRPHSHDVKALAIYHVHDNTGAMTANSTPMEVLCSGGVDTKLCTYVVDDFRKFRPKTNYPWPSISPVSLARKARVLTMLNDHSVAIHQLSKLQENAVKKLPDEKTLLGTVEIRGSHNLTCCDISDNGEYLALSDSPGLLLFRLKYVDEDDAEPIATRTIVPERLTLPKNCRSGCSAIRFLPGNTGQLITRSFTGLIKVIRIAKDEGSTDTDVELVLSVKDAAVAPNLAISPITALSISSDSRWLVTSCDTLSRGAISAFRLEINEDKLITSVSHWWSLPAMQPPATCANFIIDRKGEANLVVGCANNNIFLFDIAKRNLTSWSEKIGFPMNETLPFGVVARRDFPVRCVPVPGARNKFLMGSFGVFSTIDVEKSIPKRCRMFPEQHVRQRKKNPGRKKENKNKNTSEVISEEEEEKEETTNNNFTMCLRYNGMLFLDFLSKNEMLVVEEPWLRVVSSLPDALERRVYGT